MGSQLRSFLYLQKCVRYESVRSLRGGVTIPLKIVKPLIPRNKERERKQGDYKKLQKANPGIGYTLGSFMDNHSIVSPTDVKTEDLEDLDISLEEADNVFNETKDEAWRKEQMKTYYNTKRKHFKEEQLPNMLTYMEKQDIKRLNREDPEYWTCERLAESYPATPEIIKKILKSKFVAYTVSNIQNHDRKVQHNWHLFKNGQLHFDEELRKKYSSFMNRPKQEMNEKDIKKLIPPPPDFASQIPIKEFSSIISSSKAYKLKQEEMNKKVETEDSGRMIYNAPTADVKIIEEDEYSNEEKKHYTLEKFRKNLSSKNPDKVSDVDKIIVSEKPAAELPMSTEIGKYQMECQNFNYDLDTGITSHDYSPCLVDEINNKYDFPLRINIPRKLWQKDKLFKVNDCFYNDQGYFLYRVPGFVN